MSDSDSTSTEKQATITTPTDRTNDIVREFDAPRERVFEALTDPASISRWWGLDSSETIVDEMDVRAGGRWRYVERMEDGTETAFRGVYREVTPPERLVWTFEWEGMPGHVSIDAMTLEDLGEGRCRIVSTSTFHEPEERDGMIEAGMEKGLNQSYRSLDRMLAEQV
jgi:uncharacterized protein YndB with AHSA1/START domain